MDAKLPLYALFRCESVLCPDCHIPYHLHDPEEELFGGILEVYCFCPESPRFSPWDQHRRIPALLPRPRVDNCRFYIVDGAELVPFEFRSDEDGAAGRAFVWRCRWCAQRYCDW